MNKPFGLVLLAICGALLAAVPRALAAAEEKKPNIVVILADDPAETKDVMAANVQRAAQMKKILVAARDRGFTRPDAGPVNQPAAK